MCINAVERAGARSRAVLAIGSGYTREHFNETGLVMAKWDAFRASVLALVNHQQDWSERFERIRSVAELAIARKLVS